MKRLIIFTLLLLAVVNTWAQRFEDYFEDRTLRIDYTFSGNHELQQLYVDELVVMPRWYGHLLKTGILFGGCCKRSCR